MMRCPHCNLRMVIREGEGRTVCLSCATVFLDDPRRDPLASVAIENASRASRDTGRRSKRVPQERHTDGLTHVMGTHDQPWRSEVS
jgi:transcription initiation factor TFIIIB Brf1 subunit/transcription initiation factor TFIIB